MPRLMEISTPLGEDLLFHGMHAREELGRPSTFHLDLLSTRGNIDLDEILGKNVTIRVALQDDSMRYFNGYVTRFAQRGMYGRYHRYAADVSSWLWFLTRTADCRIFQEMTVPDIFKQVFSEHEANDFAVELTGSYRTRTYCVQYRETDFNFVSRLMEEEGIYYYFRYTDGHNTLVLVDSASAHTPTPGYEAVPFAAPGEILRPEEEHIAGWEFRREIQPGVYTHADYDFERPGVKLRAQKLRPRGYTPSDYEVFDYPGLWLQKSDGEQYADVRIDEYAAQFELAEGVANARGLCTGALVTVKDCPRDDQNREYLIVATGHDLEFGGYEGVPESDGGASFRCSFVMMPSQQQFRPRRVTPKPFVQGPQTAKVTGPAGEEIYTDQFGRVKVQFHWDRYGTEDENSSCWIRVSQPWAGKGWGSVSTPRIGQEVIVDFLEGDPDQPIITGRVYNADCQPPFGFPAGAVISGIKSQTHKGAGFNEISADDTVGKERINIHGQYNMDTAVGNNQTCSVGVDQSNSVGSNQKEDVGVNREISIGSDDKVTIGANRETSVGAKHTVSVGADETVNVGGSRTRSVAGKEDISIGGKSGLQVGASRTETIAGPHTIVNPMMTMTTAGKWTAAAGSNLTGTSPKVNLLAGSKFLANSGGKMDVKAGAALNQESGAAMNVKAGAALKMQSAAAMNLKAGGAMKSQSSGAMNLKAGGTITGKGSSIKLNSPTKIKGTTLTVK